MKARAMMRESAAKKLQETEDASEPVTTPVEDEQEEAEEEPERDEERPKEAKPARREPRPPREPGTNKVMQEMRSNEDRNLKDWLEELSPGGAIRVKVTRTMPKVWKGLNVGGAVATYEQQIDEEWIRDHHGGGDYYLVVQKPKLGGAGWQYAGGRVLRIAGDPRTDDVFRDKSGEQQAAAPANPAGGIVDRVVGSLERQLERAQQQANQPHQSSGDVETMRMLMAQSQRQIDSLAGMLREKDAQLADASRVKPPAGDEFRDRMLDKLLDGDSARITGLRSQYESELRQVKQASLDNEARLRDSFERDKAQIYSSHEREVGIVRSSYDLRLVSQETSAATGHTLLEGEVRRLERDLGEARAEMTALRLKKDKSILEQANEFAAIKEAISDITGDAEEKTAFDKFIEAAGPAVQNIAARFAGPAQAAAAVVNPAPARRVLTSPQGRPYVQMSDGTVRPLPQRPARPRPPANPGNPEPKQPPNIAPATLKMSVDFLESAFRNGHEPEGVATSVRSMIPAEVLTVIRELGVDAFLTDVAKIDATSPLGTQAGRNWARKVGKALLG